MKAIDTAGNVIHGTLHELIRKGSVHLEKQRQLGRHASWHIQDDEGNDVRFSSDLAVLKKAGYTEKEIATRFIDN